MLDASRDATRPSHAPADHPKVPRAKTGVLLANLGTPDRPDARAVRLGVQCVTVMFITDTDGHAGGHFDRLRDFAWRPTAHAVRNMIQQMPHPKLAGIQSDGENLNHVYEFKSDALDPGSPVVIMAFRIQDPRMVRIKVPYRRARVTDMLGDSVEVEAKGGKIAVELGPYPVYVRKAP